MNCEEVESNLIEYLDHSLSDEMTREMEDHLASCLRCTGQLKEIQIILDLISTTKMEKPDESLKINFTHMLQSEISQQKMKSDKSRNLSIINRMPPLMLKIAAGIALFVAGAIVTTFILHHIPENNTVAQLNELKGELKDMKKMLLLTLSDEDSPSERIKAINYVEDIPAPDVKILNALIHTLNNDKNVNVKLAAAYSLAKFTRIPLVRDSLVESLGKQTEPLIQVILMNILTENRDLQAVKPMKKIISNQRTMEQVRVMAQKNLKVLM